MESSGQRPAELMSDQELVCALDQADADLARIETRRLRLIAALDARGYAEQVGARDTVQFVEYRYRLDHYRARRDIQLARALPKYPAVTAALPDTEPDTGPDAGERLADEPTAPGVRLRPAQAEAIVTALEKVPTTVPVADLEVAEHELVRLARHLPPVELRKAAEQARDILDTDGPEPEEHKAYARETLTLTTADRGVKFRGYLANENAELLRTLITAGARPHKTLDGAPDPRPRDKRQADALTTTLTLAATALDTGTPSPTIPRPTTPPQNTPAQNTPAQNTWGQTTPAAPSPPDRTSPGAPAPTTPGPTTPGPTTPGRPTPDPATSTTPGTATPGTATSATATSATTTSATSATTTSATTTSATSSTATSGTATSGTATSGTATSGTGSSGTVGVDASAVGATAGAAVRGGSAAGVGSSAGCGVVVDLERGAVDDRAVDRVVDRVGAGVGAGAGVRSPGGSGGEVVPGFGAKANITVTIDLHDLTAATADAVGDTVYSGGLSAATIRRLACDAKIIPLVLGANSEPLDVGRCERLVTRAIRRALNTRDRGCVICGAPPVMCDAHHLISWIDGGETKIDNLALLCRRDHVDLHNGHWTITITDGIVHVTRPTWADPPPPALRKPPDDVRQPPANPSHAPEPGSAGAKPPDPAGGGTTRPDPARGSAPSPDPPGGGAMSTDNRSTRTSSPPADPWGDTASPAATATGLRSGRWKADRATYAEAARFAVWGTATNEADTGPPPFATI